MTLQALAIEAAMLWGAKPLRVLRNRENAVFEVTLPTGRAALRLHRLGYQNSAAIDSELWWSAELAKRGVAVPAALRAQNGQFLQCLSNGRLASMISWVEGEALGEAGVLFSTSPETQLQRHHDLGLLLAQIHTVTDTLTLPASFQRPRWDIEGLVGETPFWGRFWEHPLATPAQAALLREARALLTHGLQAYAQGGDFGLIHADVLRENVLVNKSSLSLIDFDDSGFGFRPYDLGTVLSQNLYEPAYPEIRAALLQGYGGQISIDLADLFTLARVCASVGWAAPRLPMEDPVHISHLARAEMLAERLLR
jgi:Ser/Thr protein kinase RdoA (MazF antagonist)